MSKVTAEPSQEETNSLVSKYKAGQIWEDRHGDSWKISDDPDHAFFWYKEESQWCPLPEALCSVEEEWGPLTLVKDEHGNTDPKYLAEALGLDVPDDQDIDRALESLENMLEEEKVLLSNQDPVNHPGHYTSHPSGVECIQITEHMNFCLGNAVKYIWRAGLKYGDPIQDLQKAAFYINREVQRLEGSDD